MVSLLTKTLFLQILISSVSAHDTSNPQCQTLPTLREQADIQDAWKQEREAAIPQLLQKYNVGAWLVSRTLLQPDSPHLRSLPLDEPERIC